jgi:hypothetical protein
MRINFNTARSGSSGVSNKVGMGCLTLFLLPFCAVGVGGFIAGIGQLSGDDPKRGAFLMLFSLIFGGVGFGLLYAAWRGHKVEQELARLRAERPGEPWITRADWVSGRIKCSSKTGMWAMWVFALIWNAISWPVVFAVPGELAKGNKPILIALIFPAVGIGFIIAAILATMRYRKFGISWFEMASVPGAVGGYLAGVIRVNRPLLGAEVVEVRLVNINRVVTGSGKNRSTSERIVWESLGVLNKDFDIPVYFSIPDEVQATNEENQNNSYLWRLEVRARMPGVDYNAQFEVPVFRVASQPTAPDFVRDLDRYRVVDSPMETPPDAKVVFNRYGMNGPEFFFPACRTPGFAIVTTIIFAALAVGAWLMWNAMVPKIFPVGMLLFDLLVFYSVMNAWFARSRVTINPGAITVQNGLPGLAKARAIRSDEISQIKATPGANMGGKVYYDLNVHLTSGRKVRLASMIESQREADWIVDRMADCLSGR